MLSSWKHRSFVAALIAGTLSLGACSSSETSEGPYHVADLVTSFNEESFPEDAEATEAVEAVVEGPNLSPDLLAKYRDGLAEGKEKYPNVGSTYRSEFDWDCPLVNSVTVAGEKVKSGRALIGQPQQGVFVFGCTFYEGIPIDLMFVEVDTAAQLAERRQIASTPIYPQERETEEMEISGYQVTVVRTEFPTNPKAGTQWNAHVFDEDALAEVFLEVSNSETRPVDYNGQDVAHELVDILQS